MIRDIIVSLALLTGTILMLFASLGLLRFGDALCRAHALAKATSFGACLMLVGLWIALADDISGLKLALVIAFLVLTVPLASHLVCLLSYRKNNVEDSAGHTGDSGGEASPRSDPNP